MKNERIEVQATLTNKKDIDYYPIPGRVPQPTQVYELHFDTDTGLVILEVSAFEYEVVEIGDHGTLIYEGHKLISFGNKIKEFYM